MLAGLGENVSAQILVATDMLEDICSDIYAGLGREYYRIKFAFSNLRKKEKILMHVMYAYSLIAYASGYISAWPAVLIPLIISCYAIRVNIRHEAFFIRESISQALEVLINHHTRQIIAGHNHHMLD